MEKTLIKMLQEIGLTELEALVYLGLLQSKSGTAYDASKKLKTRTTIYPTLKKLKEKNLVFENKGKGKRVTYSPKNIDSFVEERRETLDAVFKNIITLTDRVKDEKATSIKIFSGVDQLRDALLYGVGNLAEPVIYCVYASAQQSTITPKETTFFTVDVALKKKGIHKIILSDSKVKKAYDDLEKELGFVRYKIDTPLFQKIKSYTLGIEIHKDKLIKLFFYKEDLVCVIESESLANIALLMFKLAIPK